MSFASAKFIPLQDKVGPIFTGGVVDNSPPNVISYSKTPYSRNFRVNAGGISLRPWFLEQASLWASWAGKGMVSYIRATASNDSIICRFNTDATHKLVGVNPSTYTTTSIVTAGNIVSDNRMTFATAGDAVYCMNGSDLYGKLSGTTYTVPATGVANFNPKFWVWFNNAMWCAGTSSNPTRLYKSVENNADDFNSAGSDYFDAAFPIVGLGLGGQTLYIFTEQTIDMINTSSIKQVGSSLVYTTIPLESKEGAVNHKSIVNVGKNLYFLTKSNKINQVTPNPIGGYDVFELSHKINDGINVTMATLDSDQSDSWAYALPDKQLIKWHLKSAGATYPDICIVYHFEYKEWMVDTNKSFYDGAWYKNKSYTISALSPSFYQDEYSYSDDDEAIQFEYRSKHLDYWDPTVNKELWQARLFLNMNSATTLEQRVYADGGLVDSKTIESSLIPNIAQGIGTKAIGTYAIGEDWQPEDTQYDLSIVREKGNLQVRAKYFQFIYLCSAIGANFLIKRLDTRIQWLDELTTSTN